MKYCSLSVIFIALILSFSCSTKSTRKVQTAGNGLKPPASDYLSPLSDTGFFARLNLEFPGMEEVKSSVVQGDLEKAKAAYLNFRRNKSQAKWRINAADKPVTAASATYPQADLTMKHIYPASMSAPEAFLGDDINWEYNPVAPTEPYFTKEWTWCNLNRMPFWNTLGRAYWQTLDEKFAKEWVSEMVDWVEDNPVPLNEGPGNTLTWRTIESGIRMAGSWMNAYYYFLNSPEFTPDAHATFVKGIIEHGQRLEKTAVDFPERSGNWITMENNGLGTIGILFPELKMAERYRSIAFDRLNKELDKQVYPDGAEVELTTSYHQVSRSNFMELAKTAQLNNAAIPEGYIDKLKKMYLFNLYMMDPSGILPPFNDASPTRTASSLREAYEIWKDPEFLFGATLGKEGKKPGFDSYYFNWAGYYIMRSGWNKKDNCLYFDAGPVGYGHEHEDMLNLYLYSMGKILLTEPGTYSYDLSDWRRYALSTPGHNTIIVDGKEQHRADIPGSRLIREPMKNPWLTTPLFDYGAGTYSSGYQENKYVAVQYMPKEYVGVKDTSISHSRLVFFLKPWYYVAVDFLDGTGEHTYEAHWHLDAPEAKVIDPTMAVQTMRTDSVQLGLYPMDMDNLETKIVKGQENPILGWLPHDKRPIPTVVYSKKAAAPAVFSTLIYPYFMTVPEVSYSKIVMNNSGLWGEKIITPHENAALIINRSKNKAATELKPEIGQPFTTDAKICMIRNPKGKDQVNYGFYLLTEFTGKDLALKTAEPSSLLVVKEADGTFLIYNSQPDALNINFTLPLKKKFTVPSNKWIRVSSAGISERDGDTALF